MQNSGYQPKFSTLDPSKPPKGGSGISDEMKG